MEGYHQTLDQIQKGHLTRDNKVLEERKLELKLGPPGGNLSPHKRAFQETITVDQETEKPQVSAVMTEQPTQPRNFSAEKDSCDTSTNPLHKRLFLMNEYRSSLNPVVGWPPVRSCRKNITITNNDSSKAAGTMKNDTEMNEKIGEKCKNTESDLFVKINMDGIPIGRKIDLKAYDSYAKLSSAVHPLFSGLLAGQDKMKLGEFSLVYEDNEGDRMLVGDVPWQMFISSAKRLRLLKISQISTLSISNRKLARIPLDSATKASTVQNGQLLD